MSDPSFCIWRFKILTPPIRKCVIATSSEGRTGSSWWMTSARIQVIRESSRTSSTMRSTGTRTRYLTLFAFTKGGKLKRSRGLTSSQRTEGWVLACSRVKTIIWTLRFMVRSRMNSKSSHLFRKLAMETVGHPNRRFNIKEIKRFQSWIRWIGLTSSISHKGILLVKSSKLSIRLQKYRNGSNKWACAWESANPWTNPK